MHKLFLSALFIAISHSSLNAADPIVIKLWPNGAPEKPGFKIEAEQELQKGDGIKRVTNVSEPTLTIQKPEAPNGTTVIVCPGGGYSILAIEHEGTQVCDFLNKLGVTTALLKYRVHGVIQTTPASNLCKMRSVPWASCGTVPRIWACGLIESAFLVFLPEVTLA